MPAKNHQDPRRIPTSDPTYPFAHLNTDSVWACACGYQGSRMQLLGHRRSKKPQCQSTRPILVRPGANLALARGDEAELDEFFGEPSHTEDTATETDAQPPDAPPPDEPAGTGGYDDSDPEEVARRLNAQRASRYAGSPLLGLDNLYSQPPTNPNGDWVIKGPDGEPQISQSREAVVMPLFVRAMYDHFRQQGWSSGDGSFSTFVVEALVEYFGGVHNLVLIVARRDEVEVG